MLSIVLIVFAILNIVCTTFAMLRLREYKKMKIELEANPPFVKCPVCDLTILGNDTMSQSVHVLCIIKTHDQIEADKIRAKEIEAAKPVPVEGAKYRITIKQVTQKAKPSYPHGWSFDSDASTWYRFHWKVIDSTDREIDAGFAEDYDDAEYTAEAVVDRHREGNKEYTY